MLEIKDLLLKFRKFLSSSEIKKKLIQEAILEVAQIDIPENKIKISNNIVYLDIKSLYKNEVFFKKEKIISKIKEKSQNQINFLDFK
jgi:hypothetical protein